MNGLLVNGQWMAFWDVVLFLTSVLTGLNLLICVGIMFELAIRFALRRSN